MNKVYAHIRKIETYMVNSSHNMVSFENHLSSFILTNNRRLDNLVKGLQNIYDLIKNVHDLINQISSEAYNESIIMRKMLNNTRNHMILTSNAMKIASIQIQVLRSLENELRIRIKAIENLIKGYITPELIAPASINKALYKVKQHLNQKYPTFKMVYSDVSFYYKTVGATFTYTDKLLYVNIRIPLTSVPFMLNVYHVISMPVHIPPTEKSTNMKETNHSTEINEIPPYLAMSPDQDFFVELSNEEYLTCKGDQLKICTTALTLKQTNTQATCATSLFFNDPTEVMRLCSFTYHTQNTPRNYDLSPTDMLINVPKSEWTLTCPNQLPKRVESCTFCVIKRECVCSLSSKDFFIPRSLGACENTNTTFEVKMAYPSNLAYLLTFFNDSILHSIEAETLLPDEIVVRHPKFNWNHKTWSDVLQNDEGFQADLKKLSKTIESDSPTFFTPLDRFIDLNDWSNSWGTMDYVFTVFGILTIVSFGMSSYLMCKMMVCSTTLIQNAQGLLISEQNRKPETKVQQYGLDVDTMVQVMVLMIFSFMTIYLLEKVHVSETLLWVEKFSQL
ncbi:unnamed protein product [Owenia fusiformis]|uniref:Uncharacterized protein n=1 Tax=Owenia fusiformis TaxID=6347 RepID=A0A8S4Q9E3_OWEFU|nr:unnamed protein product [Owenia fusiformis]